MHARTITALFYYYVHIYNNTITIIYINEVYTIFFLINFSWTQCIIPIKYI